jgi:hypothetical protein
VPPVIVPLFLLFIVVTAVLHGQDTALTPASDDTVGRVILGCDMASIVSV